MVAFFTKILRRSPIQSVTLAAFIMAIAGIISRLLGFVRDRILAAQFGAGDILDVYYAAFRLPDMMFDLLVAGALSAAFIPVFTGLMERGKQKEAWRLASGILMILVVALIGIVSILFITAPYIVAILVPGFDAEKIEMVVTFTRIMLISPLFLGMSAVFGGVLMSLRQFMIYALAPIFYNIGIIIGAVFFVHMMGPVGLAWGVVLGASLHFAITMPAAIASGFGQYYTNIVVAWQSHSVRRVLLLMGPRIFGSATQQISLIAVTFFASLTVSGSLTAFTLAHNIGSIPLGVIGVPFAVAAFPTLSTYFARKDTDAFATLIVKYVRRTFFFVMPLMMLIITLRAQIVRVVFGSGAFDWNDTIMTFQILGILGLSIFAQAMIPLLARAFYAMHNTKTPVIIGIVSVIVNILAVIFFLPLYDVYAIAIGFSFGSFVNFVLLFIYLEKELKYKALTCVHDAVLGALGAMTIATAVTYTIMRLNGIFLYQIDTLALSGFSVMWLSIFVMSAMLFHVDLFFVRVLSMTVIAAIAVQLTKSVIGTVTDLSTFGEVFTQLALAGGIGLSVYLLLGYLFGIDEFFVLRARVIKFIIRRNLEQT